MTSPTTHAGYLPGSPEYRRISLALFLAGLVTFALLYTTQPLLPTLAAHFHLDAAGAAMSMSLTTIGLGIAMLVAGPVSEVVGRTPLMLGSLFASSAIGLAAAFAPSWSMLLALRGIEGFALAGLPAVAVAYLAEEITPSAHARAAGLYIGGTAIGGMTGRLVAGFLADAAGWRAAMAAVAVIGMVSAIATWLLLPRSRGFRPAPATLRHLMDSSLAVARDPALLALFGIGACCMGAFVGTFNTIGFRLQGQPYGLSVGVTGMIFLVYAVGSFTSPWAGRLAGRYGHRTIEPLCALVMALGIFLTLLTPLPLVILGLLLFTAGFFAVHGVASGWVAARARRAGGATGQATAGYLFWYYAGSSLFGPLAGNSWERGQWGGVVWLTGGLVILVLVFAILLRRIPVLPRETRPAPEKDTAVAAQ